MNISYDYYRIFYYIAKYKSISKAAEVCFWSRSTSARSAEMPMLLYL